MNYLNHLIILLVIIIQLQHGISQTNTFCNMDYPFTRSPGNSLCSSPVCNMGCRTNSEINLQNTVNCMN